MEQRLSLQPVSCQLGRSGFIPDPWVLFSGERLPRAQRLGHLHCALQERPEEHLRALYAYMHLGGGFCCHLTLKTRKIECQGGEAIWPKIHSLLGISTQVYWMPGSNARHRDMGLEEASRYRTCNR